jgi:[FeFe] hydrogenase H-cluster maturation GTPase HydF
MNERVNIGFFGCRNVGKSSLVNVVTNQDMSVVSDVKGTTTDAVKKTMEILPIGKVLIIDKPGYYDEGELGEKRGEATKQILRNCDIAVLVTEANRELNKAEDELISIFEERGIPYIIAKNKADVIGKYENSGNVVFTSAVDKTGVEELKELIGKSIKEEKQIRLVGDLIKSKDIVVLVTPIDESAPKGRLILPQQMAIRDILDSGAVAIVTKETELEQTLKSLKEKPALVITDSQVFKVVNEIVPEEIPLTSFSILMARYKGFLDVAVNGAKAIDKLKDRDKVLIAEGCTHHRQCEDIGTVKIPKLLKKFTGKELKLEWTNGMGFPEDLKQYDLIIHCGGCMLNENEIKYRMELAVKEKVPFTNYGTAIAYMNGILERSLYCIK